MQHCLKLQTRWQIFCFTWNREVERCPVCRARFKDDPSCYRCGADLSFLLNIEQQVAALERQALHCCIKENRSAARVVLTQALALKQTPMTKVLAQFVDWLPEEQS